MRMLLERLPRPGRRAIPGGPDRRARSGGQSLVELTLVVPLLLLLFCGAADLGRAFYNYFALENAVKEGALFGARHPLCGTPSAECIDPNTVIWHVEHETRNQTASAMYASLVTPTVNECRDPAGVVRALKSCVPGDTYVVRAQLSFNAITPIIGQIVGPITLNSESRATVINQVFDPTPGLAPMKLIRADSARNESEIIGKCVEPDPVLAPGYYRSPCLDVRSRPAGALIQAVFQSGDKIQYRFIVRNNGTTPITGVTMTDSLGWPGCSMPPSTMPVAGTFTCTYQRTAPPVPDTPLSMPYPNTLTVTGAEIQPVADTVGVTVEKPPAELRVLKFVSVYPLGSDGDGSIGGVDSFGVDQSIDVFRTASKSPTVYYKVIVENTGGRTATGIVVSDSNGLPGSCAAPASLAAGDMWSCIYPKTYSTDRTVRNDVTVSASNAATKSNSATVHVSTCGGSDKLVPFLIGLDDVSGPAAWANAGFTGTYVNITSGSVVTQSQWAWDCLSPTTPIRVTNTTTNR